VKKVVIHNQAPAVNYLRYPDVMFFYWRTERDRDRARINMRCMGMIERVRKRRVLIPFIQIRQFFCNNRWNCPLNVLYSRFSVGCYGIYYGTWKRTNDNNVTVTIEANKLIFRNPNTNNSYTLENLSWVQRSNRGDTAGNYPTGYAITGKVTYQSNPNWPDGMKRNSNYTDYWYIHFDGKSLNGGDRVGDRFGYSSMTYIKQ